MKEWELTDEEYEAMKLNYFDSQYVAHAAQKKLVEYIKQNLHESPGCSYKWCFSDKRRQELLDFYEVK